MEVLRFDKVMSDKGWYIFPEVVPSDLISDMQKDLEKAHTNCRKIQLRNGLDNMEGTTHHLIGQGESFLRYLELFEDFNPYVESYFGGKYILNAFGGNLLTKDSSYASSVHRDIRSYSAHIPMMLNTIAMLDDFTIENGATRLMNRGHVLADKPDDRNFDQSSFHIIGKAGSVVFFNSNMWHKAGDNRTDKARRSVTPMFTKPFFKQQFDYTQFCDDTSSTWLKQILGYNSRIPTTLSEWYKPKEKRYYRSDQG